MTFVDNSTDEPGIDILSERNESNNTLKRKRTIIVDRQLFPSDASSIY
jgi:hypothetical protein